MNNTTTQTEDKPPAKSPWQFLQYRYGKDEWHGYFNNQQVVCPSCGCRRFAFPPRDGKRNKPTCIRCEASLFDEIAKIVEARKKAEQANKELVK